MGFYNTVYEIGYILFSFGDAEAGGGGDREMKKSVTIRDIAREAGVSSTTVSRYLNQNGYVDAQTAERIRAVVEQFNYRPSRIAQSLKTRESHNLALIVPDIQNPFYSSMANKIQNLLLREGYTATFFDSGADFQREMTCLGVAESIGADGILFASVSSRRIILNELERIGVPVVMINSYDACPFDSVHGVRSESTYLTTRHLIELGHREIAFAGGTPGTAIAQSRKNGYLNAMQEAGLPVRRDYLIEMGFDSESGRKCGTYFSALFQMPTAICCANDLVALGMLQVLIERGFQVPQDISITGVDNIEYGDLCSPPLTSVINDSGEFAKMAVKALMERLRGSYTGAPREFLIPRRLVVRGSTAQPQRKEQEA